MDFMTPARPGGVALDSAPPLPAEATRRAPGMMEGPPTGPLGAEGGSPQFQALSGLKQMEDGITRLATALPGMEQYLAPMLAMISQLREVVPRAMVGQSQPTPAVPGITPPMAPPGMGGAGPGPGMGAMGPVGQLPPAA